MAENFTPGETVSLAAQATISSVSFTLAQSANYPDCLVSNVGNQTAFLGFGANAQTSGLNATPILPGETMVLRKGAGVVQCSAILAATAGGSTLLYFTAGQGS